MSGLGPEAVAFLADHPRGELLRRKGLTLWFEEADPSAVFGARGIKSAARRLASLSPVFDWFAGGK